MNITMSDSCHKLLVDILETVWPWIIIIYVLVCRRGGGSRNCQSQIQKETRYRSLDLLTLAKDSHRRTLHDLWMLESWSLTEFSSSLNPTSLRVTLKGPCRHNKPDQIRNNVLSDVQFSTVPQQEIWSNHYKMNMIYSHI